MAEPTDPGSEPADPPGLGMTVLRGAGLAGVGYGLTQILTLVVYIVLARLLEPAEFGQFAAATILIGFVLVITEGGLMSAVIQRRDRIEEAASTATVASLANGVLFSLLALAIAPLIGIVFDSSEIGALAAVMSGTIFLKASATVPEALLQRRFSFLRRLIIEPLQMIAMGAAAIIAASEGLGAWSLVIGQYAWAVFAVLLSWGLVRWRPRLSLVSFGMWRELVSYGRHVFTATTILRLGEQSDALIVGKGIGEAALGQFRYAYRIASTPFLALLAGASYVLFPAFSRISHDPARMRDAFAQATRWMLAIAIPSGLILVPLGESIAVTVFGEVWRTAGLAAVAMCLLPAGSALSSVVSEGLKAHGDPSPLTRMHTMTAVVSVLSMLALLPLGVEWVAAGLSIGAVAGGLYSVRFAVAAFGIASRQIYGSAVAPLVASAAMVVVLFPLEHWLAQADERGALAAVAILIGEGAVGIGIYAAVLRLVAPETAAEVVGKVTMFVRARRARSSE